MKTAITFIKKYLTNGMMPYVLLGLSLILCYAIFSPFIGLPDRNNLQLSFEGSLNVRICMIDGILLILGVVATLYFIHRITAKKLTMAVIAAGVVMRVGYMLYTPFFAREHDMGSLSDSGHFAYIYNFFNNLSLPATNEGQFYHPPLAHFLCAIVARIDDFFTQSTNLDTIFESAKLVPCFASCALLFVCYKIFKELKLDDNAKLFAMAIIAFQPTFYILSSSINNDMLMIFFFMVSFLYTVRWYRNPTFKSIILLAVSIGCAMSTKFSGSLIAVITAAVFLVMLSNNIKTKFLPRLLGQFAVFASICLPLGLWYYIRNMILFGQKIGYVLQIGMKSPLYIGGRSFADRYLSFPLSNLLNHVYCNPWGGDCQLWIYTIKCSLFGEFTFPDSHHAVAAFFIVVNLAVIIVSLVDMAYVLFFCKKTSLLAKASLFGLWAILMASFIDFNIMYPFTCTMDFRYIVPTVISGAAFIGITSSELLEKHTVVSRTFVLLNILLTILFMAASVVFYVM